MSSGFWAGSVPPWAYAVGACLFILAVLLGMWAGYERGFRHAAEEQRWEREQAKARRTHPSYRQIPTVREDNWPAPHRDDVLNYEHFDCCGQGMVPKVAAITTGEIQAITDETDIMVARWRADNDLWMAEHGLSDT